MYTDDICSGTYTLHNNTFIVIIQNITFLDNILFITYFNFEAVSKLVIVKIMISATSAKSYKMPILILKTKTNYPIRCSVFFHK